MVSNAPTLWFTGLSGSGKTTLAENLERLLKNEVGIPTTRIDGDEFRREKCPDLGYSKEDRDINIERAVFYAKELTEQGILVLASFISPYAYQRSQARDSLNPFVEIYLDCPIDICEQRDVKGMYSKARQGILTDFTGITAPYEIPSSPDITLHTDKETLEDSTIKLLRKIQEMGVIKEPVYAKLVESYS